ncbi:MAG: hypothetical protein ABIR28_14400 [Vicinamibacteria bacterium]
MTLTITMTTFSLPRCARSLALALVTVGFATTAFSQVTTPAQRGAKAAPPMAVAPVELARMGFISGAVEVQRQGGAWTPALENDPLSSGDRVRTLKGSTARLEFPWTAIAVGDESEVSLEKARVLTVQLERGRIDIDPEQSLLRTVTAEATITGSGRTLVRREGTTTFVGSYNGGADVESNGAIVRLGVNKGTLVNASAAASEAFTMAAPPKVISPAADPRYIHPGETLRLTWTGLDPVFHLEVLPIDSDVPVVSLDVATQEYDLRLEWLGTFRWRVAGRNGPVESQPSGEGLICVVEK